MLRAHGTSSEPAKNMKESEEVNPLIASSPSPSSSSCKTTWKDHAAAILVVFRDPKLARQNVFPLLMRKSSILLGSGLLMVIMVLIQVATHTSLSTSLAPWSAYKDLYYTSPYHPHHNQDENPVISWTTTPTPHDRPTYREIYNLVYRCNPTSPDVKLPPNRMARKDLEEDVKDQTWFHTSINTTLNLLVMGDSVAMQMAQILQEATNIVPKTRKVMRNLEDEDDGHESLFWGSTAEGGGSGGYRLLHWWLRRNHNKPLPETSGGGWVMEDVENLLSAIRKQSRSNPNRRLSDRVPSRTTKKREDERKKHHKVRGHEGREREFRHARRDVTDRVTGDTVATRRRQQDDDEEEGEADNGRVNVLVGNPDLVEEKHSNGELERREAEEPKRKTNDRKSVAASMAEKHVHGNVDVLIFRVSQPWMHWSTMTPENMAKTVEVARELLGVTTVVFLTIPFSNNIVSNYDIQQMHRTNKMIRQFAAAYHHDQVTVVTLDMARLHDTLLRENARQQGYDEHSIRPSEHSNWPLESYDFALETLQQVAEYYSWSIPHVCGDRVVTNSESCVNHNMLTVDGQHLCFKTIGGRFMAGMACVIRCATSYSDDREELRECERACNDQYMTLEPIKIIGEHGALVDLQDLAAF